MSKQINTWTWPIIDALKMSAGMLEDICGCDPHESCRLCQQAKENRKLVRHFETCYPFDNKTAKQALVALKVGKGEHEKDN